MAAVGSFLGQPLQANGRHRSGSVGPIIGSSPPDLLEAIRSPPTARLQNDRLARDSFYRFKELYDAGGELALQELTRRKPILKNRTPPDVEAIIVELSLNVES
jgi:hypothetical protein